MRSDSSVGCMWRELASKLACAGDVHPLQIVHFTSDSVLLRPRTS